MIRKLRADDKEQYIELIRMFVDERMGEFGIKFDQEEASKQFDMFFQMNEIIAVVIDIDGKLVGTVAGIIGPMLFCKGLMVQEMVWYVNKEHRGISSGIRLLREFEKIAKERGCASIIMVGMVGDSSNDFYLKDGYKLLQNNYYKGF